MAQHSKLIRELTEYINALTPRGENDRPPSPPRVEPIAPTTPATNDVIVRGSTLETPQGSRLVELSVGGGISAGAEAAELPTVSRLAPTATAGVSGQPEPSAAEQPVQPPATAYTRNQKFQTPEGEVTFKRTHGAAPHQNVVFEIAGNPIRQVLPREKFDALVRQAANPPEQKQEAAPPTPDEILDQLAARGAPLPAGFTLLPEEPVTSVPTPQGAGPIFHGQPNETTPATARRQPTNGETHTPRLPTDFLELSREETAEHQRLCSLYDGLSSEERAFVSVQWDCDHGLECWQERLVNKKEAPRLAARRRWQTYGVVAVLLWYGGCCYDAYRDAQYARDRLEWLAQKAQKDNALKAAIEEVDRERYEYYRSLKEDDEQ